MTAVPPSGAPAVADDVRLVPAQQPSRRAARHDTGVTGVTAVPSGTGGPGGPRDGAGRGHRPEVQGLRALAVGLVVLYHFWPGLLPGGYVGVDVFFVISGFLITGHLASALASGGPHPVLAFYDRRIRRLLPSALLVLLVVLLWAFASVPRPEWSSVARQVMASALYLHNWTLAQDAVDYLARPDLDAVQHYWSLCVEEQFYAVWPLLLLIAVTLSGRTGRRVSRRTALLATVGLVTTASFALCVAQTATSPASVYFSAPARAWEFGAGALLALAAPRLRGPLAVVASASGMVVVVACGLLFTATTAFPGWIAALPVLGTVLVIAAGSPTGRLSPARLLCARPAQWLGDRSYTLYLWHFPLLVFLPMTLGRDLDDVELVVLLAGTVVAAALTTRYVEHAFRRGSSPAFPWRAVGGAVAGTAVIGLVAGTMLAVVRAESATASKRLAATVAAEPACFGASTPPAGSPACPVTTTTAGLVPDPLILRDDKLRRDCLQALTAPAVIRCDIRSGGTARVALVGDSLAQQWLPAVSRLADERNWSLVTYTKAGCPFFDAPASYDPAGSCAAWNRSVREQLASERYDVVFVSSNASGPEGVPHTADPDRVARTETVWRPLVAQGTRLVAIGATPVPKNAGVVDPADCVARNRLVALCSLPTGRVLGADPLAVAARAVPGVEYVNLVPALCTAGECPMALGGVVVYRDDTHLSATFARTLAPVLGRALDGD